VFVLYEEYTDRAALDAHLATDHFRQYGLNGVRLLAKERVAHLCHPID
jgi:quinol monooxygenase YgiN